jgi:hypothetical protein
MNRRPDGTPQPSLRLVRDDDELVQQIADRREIVEHDDPVLAMLEGWATEIDLDLPEDLAEGAPRPLPSRRTVIVTRAGVAASVAAVVLSGVTVAAAASEGGLAGFVSKVERGVEKGVAAPRPADAAVLATADATSHGPDGHSVRTALNLASQRLKAGDRDAAAAVLSLVEDQVRRDPSLLGEGDHALLAAVRQDLSGSGSGDDGMVLADPPRTAAASASPTRPGSRSPDRSGTGSPAAGPVTTRPSSSPSTSPTSTPTPTTTPSSPTQTPTTQPTVPTTQPTTQPTTSRPTSPTTRPTSPGPRPSSPTAPATQGVQPNPTPSVTGTGTPRVESRTPTSGRTRTFGITQQGTPARDRSTSLTVAPSAARSGGHGGDQP